MINNITTIDTRPQVSVAKTVASKHSFSMPPIIGFKTPILKQKADIRIKKIKRGDNIIIPGEIDDDYVDIVEEEIPVYPKFGQVTGQNFFENASVLAQHPQTRKIKYLKNCYIIDYIQSPKTHCGLGTEAIKQLAEKAMFDTRAEGRIVTFSSPIVKELSPAIFFYKLGFRFTSPEANEYIEKCIKDNVPDIPAQTGMMYLPQTRLHKLLRYGDLF